MWNAVCNPFLECEERDIGWNSSSTLWLVWRIHSARTLQRSTPNRYQPHTAVPAQHITCSNTRLGLLKMGIMMPETCWESVDNKLLTIASCWFSLSLHNLYGEHAMSSSMVWRWVQLFNEGHKNVHDDFWSGWLSVVNEDLLRAFEEKIRENRRFATTSLSLHFPQISWSLLYQIVSDKIKFRKLCAHCVPKMLTQ